MHRGQFSAFEDFCLQLSLPLSRSRAAIIIQQAWASSVEPWKGQVLEGVTARESRAPQCVMYVCKTTGRASEFSQPRPSTFTEHVTWDFEHSPGSALL